MLVDVIGGLAVNGITAALSGQHLSQEVECNGADVSIHRIVAIWFE